MAARDGKRRFLVVYDYGMGGVWAFVWARSPQEIHQTFRDLEVIDRVPAWMTEDQRARIEQSMTFDVDEVGPDAWIARLLRTH